MHRWCGLKISKISQTEFHRIPKLVAKLPITYHTLDVQIDITALHDTNIQKKRKIKRHLILSVSISLIFRRFILQDENLSGAPIITGRNQK